jgi:hypothetical protein
VNEPGFARNRAESAEHGVDVDARRVDGKNRGQTTRRGARDELRQAWCGARVAPNGQPASERTERGTTMRIATMLAALLLLSTVADATL